VPQFDRKSEKWQKIDGEMSSKWKLSSHRSS